MFILEGVDMCNDLAVLRTIKFIKNLLEVIRILVPVILTVLCMVDFAKALFAGEDKQITSTMVKRFMSAIIVFFIIPLVNLVFQLLGESKVDASECWNNANDSNIEVLAAKEEAEMEALRNEKKINEQNIYNETMKKIEEAKKLANSNNNSQAGPIISSSVGNYIYYNQGSYAHVGFCKNGKTVQSAGCSAVSFAIVAANLVNNSYEPAGVANWLCSHIHGNGGLAAEKLLNSEFLNLYGLNGERLFYEVRDNNVDSAKQKLMKALNQGKMIILYIPGHYVVLAKAENNNQVIWMDPGKKDNNGTYTLDQVWERTKNYKNRCTNKGNCGWHGAFAYTKK